MVSAGALELQCLDGSSDALLIVPYDPGQVLDYSVTQVFHHKVVIITLTNFTGLAQVIKELKQTRLRKKCLVSGKH